MVDLVWGSFADDENVVAVFSHLGVGEDDFHGVVVVGNLEGDFVKDDGVLVGGGEGDGFHCELLLVKSELPADDAGLAGEGVEGGGEFGKFFGEVESLVAAFFDGEFHPGFAGGLEGDVDGVGDFVGDGEEEGARHGGGVN
jgi:hypothetical protein